MRAIWLATLLPLVACGNISSGGDDGDDGKPGIPGSGSGNARSYAVAGFSAIAMRGADDVDVRVGSGFSVRAEGDPAVLDKLKIEKVGDTLRVGRVQSRGFDWSSHKGAKIYVTMPRIVSADLAGAGNLAIDRVDGPSFKAASAGAGDVAIGTLAVQQVSFDLAGAGDVKVGGSTGSFSVSIAGAGDIDGSRLTATSADISIAGSGSVKARVNGAAKVSIMGSGDVDLGPQARCTTSKMGAGTVRCGG